MRVLDVDGRFDQMKFCHLRHQLAGHPLMTVESLAALALRLDPAHVRFHEGERTVGTHMGDMLTNDPTRQSLRRTLDNLHNAKAFVQIVNVRSDPDYRAMIDEVLVFLEGRTNEVIGRVRQRMELAVVLGKRSRDQLPALVHPGTVVIAQNKNGAPPPPLPFRRRPRRYRRPGSEPLRGREGTQPPSRSRRRRR
jgi:hypothetical protein